MCIRDRNRGDYQNGWDTDQFPNNIYEIVESLLVIIQSGGFQGGGINFDAKTRRNSIDLNDMFYSHIGAIDLFAKGLLITEKILNDSEYSKLLKERYASFDKGKGKDFEDGKISMKDLYQHASKLKEPKLISGRQELFENIINRYI